MKFEQIPNNFEEKKKTEASLLDVYNSIIRRYGHILKVRSELSSIEEIGSLEERNNLISILENPKKYSREQLVSTVIKNYSGEVWGDSHNEKTGKHWGGSNDGEEFTTQYGRFRSEYPHLKQLTLDPGFMNHLPEFMEMVKKQAITSLSAIEVRQILKETLGVQEVYRGMMLTEAQMEEMKHVGILAAIPRAMEHSEHPVDKEFEVCALTINTKDMNYYHFNAGASASTMMSVSSMKEVATSAGKEFGRYDEKNKKHYLMKLNIPVIDLLYWEENSMNQRVTKEKESFVFWKINPEEIMEIEEVISKD